MSIQLQAASEEALAAAATDINISDDTSNENTIVYGPLNRDDADAHHVNEQEIQHGDEQSHAVVEEPPSGGEQLPAGGEQLPAGGEQLPAGGEQLPAELLAAEGIAEARDRGSVRQSTRMQTQESKRLQQEALTLKLQARIQEGMKAARHTYRVCADSNDAQAIRKQRDEFECEMKGIEKMYGNLMKLCGGVVAQEIKTLYFQLQTSAQDLASKVANALHLERKSRASSRASGSRASGSRASGSRASGSQAGSHGPGAPSSKGNKSKRSEKRSSLANQMKDLEKRLKELKTKSMKKMSPATEANVERLYQMYPRSTKLITYTTTYIDTALT